MSKEKMDRYKAAKANKEEIRKKQKRTKTFTILAWIIIPLAIIGLLVWGIYTINHPKVETINYDLNEFTTETGDMSQYGSDITETFYDVEDFINATDESVVEETADAADAEQSDDEADAAEENAEQPAEDATVNE